MNDKIQPSPWTSFRTYETATGEFRSVIYDELNHKIFFLDGDSARIWKLVENRYPVAEFIKKAGGFCEVVEAEEFLNLLINDGLISAKQQTNTTPKKADIPPTPKTVTEQDRGSEMRDFQMWVTENGFLFSVHWEITWRCNEKCVHCYNPGAAHLPDEKPDRDTHELTTEEAKNALDQMRAVGVFQITLSGGEPMMRSDFWEIVGYARHLGFALNLYTNGLKLSPENIKRLAALYPSSVSISIYSPEASVHDAVTQIPGSFERSIGVLKQLHEVGIATYMKSIQMNHTLRSHELVMDLAKDIGAGGEIDMFMSSAADGASAPLALAAQSPEELIVMAATPGTTLFVGSLEDGFNFARREIDATVCGAGVGSLSLDPEGQVLVCSSMPIPCGTVKNSGLKSIWEDSRTYKTAKHRAASLSTVGLESLDDALSKWQKITLKDYHECGTHDRCLWCQKCPGLAMLEHGDPLGPSTTNCRLATARMVAASLLSQGESRATIADRLGVDLNFGRLNARELITANQDKSRESGFEPRNAALANMGCSSCSSCGSGNGCGISNPVSFNFGGKLELKNGTGATAEALRSVYATLGKFDLTELPRPKGVPLPPRHLA